MALPIFIALQFLDAMTTLVFLSQGITEGNPILAWLIPHAQVPWMGLVAAKLLATILAVYCDRKGRLTVIRLANTGYTAIVGWNVISIAAATVPRWM